MVFSSLPFIYLFFVLCLLLYFISKNIKWKNTVLLIFSLVFYTWGDHKLIFLLLACAFICYISGMLLSRYDGDAKRRKAVLVITVALTLSILGFFKYWGFILGNINFIFKSQIPAFDIALPLGISFYTFQALTYVIDVYRKETPVQKSYPKFLLYISMFPQLVAGPIVRYSDIAEQIDHRTTNAEKFAKGVIRFTAGLGKKVLIANSLGELSSLLIEGDKLYDVSVIGAWTGIFCFALQIYYDFSGYSDMAIGLGHMFGFDYLENFRFPYISCSVTEFWRRWHISLGTFFRDYVYIPLGGNRKHQTLNLLIVWLLTGLWHGASWNFMLWGLYFSVFLILEKKLFLRFFERVKVIGWVYTAFVVLCGWVIFYYTDMSQVAYMFKVMFGFSGRPFNDLFINLTINGYFYYIFAGIIGCIPLSGIVNRLINSMYGKNAFFRGTAVTVQTAFVLVILLLSSAALVGSSYNPFLYFRF